MTTSTFGSGTPQRPGWISRVDIPVTTDGSGNATVLSTDEVTGRVLQMRYTPDGTSPLDTGADITVTTDITGVNILTKANIGTSAFTSAPRQPTHSSVDGSASLYAAAGAAVNDYIWLAAEHIKVVVAQGVASKKGVFTFYIG